MNIPDIPHPKISNKHIGPQFQNDSEIMHATTRSNHRSIFPDTIARRSEQKWSFANSSHFFPLFSLFSPFFFPHYSIHVAIATPHATSRIKRNTSTAAANFGKQALRAFHFAVIYGPPILQIRHLFGRVSRKLAIVAPSV